jgi:hypothetical protein
MLHLDHSRELICESGAGLLTLEHKYKIAHAYGCITLSALEIDRHKPPLLEEVSMSEEHLCP